VKVGAIRLAHRADVVDVDSWPRPDRLIVVYGRFSVRNTWGDSVAVVDPLARRVLKRVRLHGFVDDAEKLRNGSLILAVGPLRSSSAASLVLVSPEGKIRTRPLGGSLPSLVTDGVRRAFVVEDGQPLREIDLRTLRAREHRVKLTTSSSGLAQPPPFIPGSTDPRATRYRTGVWLGHGLLGISGGRDRVVRVGTLPGQQYTPYRYQVVDTRTWRTLRTFALTSCESKFGLFVCSSAVGGFEPDGKRSRGSTLVVYDRSWKLLYRKRSSSLWRDDVAGRFLAGSADGSRLAQLDPRTGAVLRRLGTMRVWPPDLLDWHAS
jgi:hypothetical protein